MRDGLRYAIERDGSATVVGEAADGGDAIIKFKRLRPDVVLMDLQMPKIDGLQAIAGIREAAPNARIVVLTTYSGDARVTRAMSLGATSYLLKITSSAEIITAIHSAFAGRAIASSDIASDLAAHRGMQPLTMRELSVLKLVACGRRNRGIGEYLHVSEQTVKSRIKNILAKLDARDRMHAVSIAVRRGFIDDFGS
jgi:DNA-binding NarL/FixJ family response regulator